MARHLPEWLAGVDICEAAEYVLPLLTGLATDQEDLVKEMFAPRIDRIMWHFFSVSAADQHALPMLTRTRTNSNVLCLSSTPARRTTLRRSRRPIPCFDSLCFGRLWLDFSSNNIQDDAYQYRG